MHSTNHCMVLIRWLTLTWNFMLTLQVNQVPLGLLTVHIIFSLRDKIPRAYNITHLNFIDGTNQMNYKL